MKKHTILKLMRRRWTAAEKVESLTARLVIAQRAARNAADALSDALAKESGARLVRIIALEHPPKSGRRKASKGAKDTPRPN
jgi:hypothetical protein